MRRYTKADGLPSETITSIEEDAAGSLWIATNHGLTRLAAAVQVPDKPELLNFDTSDGLQSLEWARNACLRRRNGEMLFGGRRGVNSFDPARIRRDPNIPPVVFTDLRIMNHSVRPGAPGSPLSRAITEITELTLSHRDSMVTFEFAALSYALPQKNRYAYRLEGFDERWNDLGTQRTATFTSLPPGRYVLHVRASNGDGVWNEEGARLRILVTPPWWGTWWFRGLLVGGALASAAGAAHRFSTIRMRRDLERLERQRAIEHDRARIARDIHDDLGAGLTQISLLSDLARGDGSGGGAGPRRADRGDGERADARDGRDRVGRESDRRHARQPLGLPQSLRPGVPRRGGHPLQGGLARAGPAHAGPGRGPAQRVPRGEGGPQQRREALRCAGGPAAAPTPETGDSRSTSRTTAAVCRARRSAGNGRPFSGRGLRQHRGADDLDRRSMRDQRPSPGSPRAAERVSAMTRTGDWTPQHARLHSKLEAPRDRRRDRRGR